MTSLLLLTMIHDSLLFPSDDDSSVRGGWWGEGESLVKWSFSIWIERNNERHDRWGKTFSMDTIY
jgi:hypothetical protein